MLVAQADNLNTGLPQIVVAMLTSKMFRANHPRRVVISLATAEGKQSGLLTDSVIMTDNLATAAETEIDRVIGKILMTTVNAALRHTLNL